MSSRLLIRNGTVVTPDALHGRRDVDVLIVDGRIAVVGNAGDADAEVIDASGTVVVPGFVDTHRHSWETAMRGSLPSCSLGGYLQAVNGLAAPRYTPEDIRIGTLAGALEALNAGITTFFDWSHCNNTPEHADAGVAGLREAGVRAVYGHGTPSLEGWWFYSDKEHPDARRVRETHFSSDDDLLTFAMAVRGPLMTLPHVVEHDWQLARELGALISVHAGMRITGFDTRMVAELEQQGLLGADTVYVHANTWTDDDFAAVAASGGRVSIAPYVEMVMGHGRPPIARSLAAGLRPGLGTDVATTVPGDLFTQMRQALAWNRIQSFPDDQSVDFESPYTEEDVFLAATRDGAAVCGLERRVGEIREGFEADIALIRTDMINTAPVGDPLASIVCSADVSNVDTVLVRGEVRKRAGKLTNVDLAKLVLELEASRERVLGGAAAEQAR